MSAFNFKWRATMLVSSLALALMGCSSIADSYKIDYDRIASSPEGKAAAAIAEDTPPAPEGSLNGAMLGPYKPLSNDSADAAHMQEVTQRAYERAQELRGQNINQPAPAPAINTTDSARQKMQRGPYPATYSPHWYYPYYRPYQLPTYWPSWRYRHPGFRSGVGVWLSH